MIPGSLPLDTRWYCNARTRDLAHITRLRLVCVTSGSSTPAVFVVHMSMEGSAWTARLAPRQDLSICGVSWRGARDGVDAFAVAGTLVGGF
jgi:hypothetical protein